MKCKLDKIIETCDYVKKNAKYVKINFQELDKVINNMELTKIKYWLESNPFNLMDFDSRTIVNFLLIYHTIGNYCFWGEPKWEIESKNGKLDGSYAMMYILIEKLKSNDKFDLTFEEFSKLLKGNVEIPLLKDRYQNLVAMNDYLKTKNSDFYQEIEKYTTDKELFNYIISNLSYFIDETTYKNKKIYFYKRAQLLTSDILHIREIKEGIKVDYSNLVGCADYKIPQVMRCYNILEFNEELSKLVDNKQPISPSSEMEIEIRACDIIVIDYIAKKTKIPRININDYIWLLGQNKSKMTKPYHRTLTNKY